MVNNVDKTTAPSYFNFWVDDNPQILKASRANFSAQGSDEKDKKSLIFNNDDFSLTSEEFYLDNDGDKPELFISFGLQGSAGSGTAAVSIPLSDEVLIDIISLAVKKLNKLKTAMESLK